MMEAALPIADKTDEKALTSDPSIGFASYRLLRPSIAGPLQPVEIPLTWSTAESLMSLEVK